MSYTGYIYIVHNKLDAKKVYIGQTRTSIKKRWTQHKSAARNAKNNKKYNTVFYNAMNKYGIESFYIEEIERIVCNTREELIDELNDLEIYYISIYNSIVPNGYNLTKGGDNTSIRIRKPVTSYFYDGSIDKIFDSVTEAGLYYNADPSHILQCCNGKAQSAANRIWRYKNNPFDIYPITINKQQLENGQCRKIDKYSLDGNFLKSYNSISEAIKDDPLVKSCTPISYCCDGKYNQAYGYVWRNSGESFDTHHWKINKNMNPVDVYDKAGNLVISANSINEAFRKLGFEYSSHAIECCNNERMFCCGYVWRYKGETFESRKIERKTRKDIHTYNHYDLGNNFIETIFGSKNLPYNSVEVNKCCNGLRTNIGKSKWFYANDINNPDKSKIIGELECYNTKMNVNFTFNKFTSQIKVYDRYGELISIYDNAKIASKELNVSTQTIYKICDGIIAYDKGLVYRYYNDDFNLYYTFEKYTSKHINIYDKNNNFIRECFDIKECIRQLNLNTTKGSSIQKCLTHERKYAYGYQFFRVSDPLQPDKTKIVA